MANDGKKIYPDQITPIRRVGNDQEEKEEEERLLQSPRL